MANKSITHVTIDPTMFKQELKSQGISIRSLGNPKSPNYIGLTDKTIQRGLKDGRFSVRTIDALSKIINIDNFVINVHYDIDLLVQENAKLKLENDALRSQNDFLKDQLNSLNTYISSILYARTKQFNTTTEI